LGVGIGEFGGELVESVEEVVEGGPTVSLSLLLGEEVLVEGVDVGGVVGFEFGEGFRFCDENVKITFEFW